MTRRAWTRDRSWIARVLAMLLLTGGAAPGYAADAPSYRVLRGEIRVECPLTVGGSFDTTTTSISGTVGLGAASPGALDGELQADLSSLDTGIALRNTHLRDKYLEVGRGAEFATAILSGVRLTRADASTFRGQTPFTGTLLLHGARWSGRRTSAPRGTKCASRPASPSVSTTTASRRPATWESGSRTRCR